jgi:hypothetical protein
MTPYRPAAIVSQAFWCFIRTGSGTPAAWALQLGVRPACVGPAEFFRMSKSTLIPLKSLQNSRVCHVLM